MDTMPINKLLLNVSTPIVVAMLVQAFYNIVDSAYIAKYNSDALVALSMAFPIQSLIIALAVGTGVGVSATLGKALGEKNFEDVNKIVHNSLILATLNGIVFILFGLFFTKGFFYSQFENPEQNMKIINYGIEYLSLCTIFSWSIFNQIMFERLLQATGKTVYNMIAQAAGAILNIIVDPILIFGLFGFPELGVKGAAISTIIAQFFGFGLALYFNITKNKELPLDIKHLKPDFNIIKRIYVVGIPTICVHSIVSFTIFLLNKIITPFTPVATAVFGVYFKLQSFVFMPVFGLSNGMLPIISYNYGAKNKDRIIKTYLLALKYTCIIMILGVIIFQVFPDKLIGIFSNSNEPEILKEMLEIGVPALRIISLSFIFAGFIIMSAAVFQALGNGMFSLIIALVRQLILIVPFAYFLSLTKNINLIWYAYPLSEIFSIVLTGFLLKYIYIKEIKNL